MHHQRNASVPSSLESQIERLVTVRARHTANSHFDPDRNITILFDHDTGFDGSCITHVNQLFGKRRMQAQTGQMHKSKNLRAADVDAEFSGS